MVARKKYCFFSRHNPLLFMELRQQIHPRGQSCPRTGEIPLLGHHRLIEDIVKSAM